MEHVPVLLEEIMTAFAETTPPIEKYFDGTFGRGGHAREVMKRFPGVKVFAMDQDLEAIAYFNENFKADGARIFHGGFERFREIFAAEGMFPDCFDIMLLDLGVSSPQLDRSERGFSFYQDGPLDMRMNRTQEVTAADLLNGLSEDELNELFQVLGEVRRPYRVVKAVVHDRKEAKFETTQQFAGLIERVEGWSKKGHHPATRYFMALRLKVNRELEQLESALPDLMRGLRHEGRLAVITFHSLEDRIVKNIFRSRKDLGKPVNKKVIQPEWEEQKKNPRARSAKLRVFQREIVS